jgi:pyridoxamine 5'-phosphate oxidase
MNKREEIGQMRRSYGDAGLSEGDLTPSPFDLFLRWLSEAAANEFIVEANAMVLSTYADEVPTSRSVLLKDVTNEGLTFFTNYNSRKARAIDKNPRVSVLFPWYAMERQVSITGIAVKVSEKESADYFATRPRESQLGAWASSQSDPLDSRNTLEERYKELDKKYPNEVPKPPHWGGFLIRPISFEFWQGRYSRLHDRFIYSRINSEDKNSNWVINRLNP